MNSETLFNDLSTRVNARFSGKLLILDSSGEREIYMRRGEIISIRSSLIDDRLGETLYREGSLNLAQWSEAAASVTRKHRFGQTLRNVGLFDDVELSGAIRRQAELMLQSIFARDSLSLFLNPGGDLYPQTFSFHDGTLYNIKKAYAEGLLIQNLSKRIPGDSQMRLSAKALAYLDEHSVGSFLPDVLSLIDHARVFDEFMVMCKLDFFAAMKAIKWLLFRDYIVFEPRLESADDAIGLRLFWIKAYEQMLLHTKDLFAEHGTILPLASLNAFVGSLASTEDNYIHLDERSGLLHPESRRAIIEIGKILGEGDMTGSDIFMGLCVFLLQLCKDYLPEGADERLHSLHDSLTSSIDYDQTRSEIDHVRDISV